MTGQDLPSLDWDAVLRDRILFHLAAAKGGVTAPVWIFVCGQPGSGKSARMARLAQDLGANQTQVISGDAIHDHLADLFADVDDPAVQAAKSEYDRAMEDMFISALVDHAARIGAHVLWEAHVPGDLAAIAGLARSLGYRVEMEVLAAPLDESWLGTLERDAIRDEAQGLVGVSWDRHLASHHRWPPFLAEVEAEVTVDALRILDRRGAVLFHNTAQLAGTTRRWIDPPAGLESLLVERLQPYGQSDLDRLVARWDALRSHPRIAFRNLAIWPHASVMSLGDRLRALQSDPAARFDLSTPDACPAGAPGWLAQLQSAIAAAAASREGQRTPSFAPRADRLLTLVRSILTPILSPGGSSGSPG